MIVTPSSSESVEYEAKRLIKKQIYQIYHRIEGGGVGCFGCLVVQPLKGRSTRFIYHTSICKNRRFTRCSKLLHIFTHQLVYMQKTKNHTHTYIYIFGVCIYIYICYLHKQMLLNTRDNIVDFLACGAFGDSLGSICGVKVCIPLTFCREAAPTYWTTTTRPFMADRNPCCFDVMSSEK